MMLRTLVLLAAYMVAAAAEWSPALHLQFRSVANVTPSPDGKLVVWAETWAVIETEKSENLTHLFLARTDGSQRVQLTRGDKSATSPQFSSDSRSVFFMSDRDGKKNLYRIPVGGGEAEKLTDWKGTLETFRVSPDGRQAAFTATEEDKDADKRKKEKTDFKLIDDKPRNAMLWVLPLDDDKKVVPKRIVQADVHIGAFDWSPDSSRIAYEHRPRPDADFARRADIGEVEIATGAVKAIAATGVTEAAPRYSPDGRYLIFERSVAARTLDGSRLVLLSRADNRLRELPPTHNESPTVVDWLPDSSGVLFAEPHGTRAVIYRMPIDGPPSPFFQPKSGTIAAGALGGSYLGLAVQSPNVPVEAYVLPIASQTPMRVSAANSGIAFPEFGKTEVIQWKGKDGLDIEGLLTYPVNYAAGKRVPLILNIHGGPAGNFVETFLGAGGAYPLATFSAKGFAVLRPNPRGSTGYGSKFRQRVIEDWGGLDFQDLMLGVDKVIAMGIGDSDRMAVMGWSYGGFMTAWTVTQTTRFKAAAVGAGVTNHVSMYGTHDIPAFFEDYFGGPPWTKADVYARSSPMNFAARIKTPTLLLHGENDERVPVGQAYEFYRAIKRQGIPAKMVVYPRQPHGVREPKFQQHVMEQHLAWVEQHLAAAK